MRLLITTACRADGFAGKRFATGVSDAAGSFAALRRSAGRYPGEYSVFRIARQAVNFVGNEHRGTLPYEITGRLSASGHQSVRFKSRGELTLPSEIFDSGM